MNPTILLCLALAVFLAVAVGVAVAALVQAPEGFEDDGGFHAVRAIPNGTTADASSEPRAPESVPLAGTVACKPASANKVAGDMLTA